MKGRDERVVVLGATGPTGTHLARTLVEKGLPVRVVARTEARLRETFRGLEVEVHAADLASVEAGRRALEGCRLAFDCVGLTPAQMELHPTVARAIAGALRTTGARCVQVSSFWSYLPVRNLPLTENHPREGGPPWVRLRREAEDILQGAGAAVLQLPDFFGPQVHTSSLQNALVQALAGRPMEFLGAADDKRDYVFVPDAMRTAIALSTKDAAFGERWIVAGSGPLSPRALAALCGELLGREARLRLAAPWMLRLLSFFSADLRRFLPMAPHYAQPIRYDASKLEQLLGAQPRTPYPEALRATFEWLRGPRDAG